MSIHINAANDAIAKTVLLAGDPLRTEYMAQHYLENVQMVSRVRNAFYFTGTYKGKAVSFGSSGMGCPSMGIYSYELYTEFDVNTIIRIGTCGAYSNNFSLFDLLIADMSVSESTYAVHAWNDHENKMLPQGNTSHLIIDTAKKISLSDNKIKIRNANIHTSDVFYRAEKGVPSIAEKYRCDAVEMETFALFANAKHLKKNAAALLTVSDTIPTREKLSADQREKALIPMMELALETAINIS